MLKIYRFLPIILLIITISGINKMNAQSVKLPWLNSSITKMEMELSNKYSKEQIPRIQRGLKQVGDFWRQEDGDAQVFEDFIRTNFAGDQNTLDVMFNRFEYLFEKLFGHMQEISREFRNQSDLDLGPILPFDEIFAGYDPSAHIMDDFFKNKIAFIVLLNYPLTTLEQRLTEGNHWTRRQWAEARLAQIFSKRIPADVNLEIAKTSSDADKYISEYNIWMHHLLDNEGKRLFPPKMRLLSHWNLRDELKADYSDPTNGFAKQKMIQQVMERIVTQTIPQIVINNPYVDWNPYTNEVKITDVRDAELPKPDSIKVSNDPEPDTRYETLLKTFHASRLLDPYSPTAPTLIARRFDENREIPEKRVREMLEKVLASPLIGEIAKIIESRLGRQLEPFDIWYNGFRPRGKYTESQLDEIVSKKYPNADAYKKDIPNLLIKLGFDRERAEYLAENIIVDPARGSGHAMGAGMRSEKAHLRTRIGKDGMNYKGYNIAIHEMGHNVEQIFSLNDIDHYFLQGVPNTAFTEALAFVFQGNDLKLLGLKDQDEHGEMLKILNDFWALYEISGVSLVDIEVWHWMYDHPDANPSELKTATLSIVKNIWNKYYAPIFKKNDVVLLGIYSHMIDSYMYLPDYALGHMIAFQVESQMKKAGVIGPEFERMAKVGRITPDMWMKNATGNIVSPDPFIEAADKAVKYFLKKSFK